MLYDSRGKSENEACCHRLNIFYLYIFGIIICTYNIIIIYLISDTMLRSCSFHVSHKVHVFRKCDSVNSIFLISGTITFSHSIGKK